MQHIERLPIGDWVAQPLYAKVTPVAKVLQTSRTRLSKPSHACILPHGCDTVGGRPSLHNLILVLMVASASRMTLGGLTNTPSTSLEHVHCRRVVARVGGILPNCYLQLEVGEHVELDYMLIRGWPNTISITVRLSMSTTLYGVPQLPSARA